MIKKLPKINNLAVFNNFVWDKSVLNKDGRPMEFEKLNIIYGRNYSGKTTLSRILRAMETGIISDKYDNPSFTVAFDDGTEINECQLSICDKTIRVFNEDFVRDNLRFFNNPDDVIEPFAILGGDNIILEDEIAVLKIQVGLKEENKETGLYAKLKKDKKILLEAKTSYRKATNSLETQLADKATGRTNGIKYNLNKFGDPNYNITKLKNDIKTVLADTYASIDDDKKSEYKQLLAEQTKPPIQAMPSTIIRFEWFCSQAKGLLSRQIGESNKIIELLRDATLNEWVKKGCELHKNRRKTCAFCSGTISDERWAVLHAHFDDETRKLEESIDNLLKQIETEIQSVKNGFMVNKDQFYGKYHDQIEQLSKDYSVVMKNYIEQLDLISGELTKRKTEITVPLTFTPPADYSKEIIKIWKSYEELRKQSDAFSGKLNKEKSRAREALRLQEVYYFCTTINYNAICDNINELEEKYSIAVNAVDTTKANIKAIEAKIQDKKRQLNDEGKGALWVNEYLTNFFGHDFLSLRAVEYNEDEKKKIHFEIVRDGKRAYHLSEGECSLIAFCYFMAKLGDTKTKDTKPIIWIDDPVSSLDGNHTFFVYSLIAAEIAEKGSFEQLFVSTHNLNFLKYLRRLKGFVQLDNEKLNECSKQYFIINRQGHYSTMHIMPKYLKEYGTEFNYLFSCIYRCSRITELDDTNVKLFYNFGNNVRKFLEVYLYFKYPDYSKDKLQRFFGDDKVPSILIDRINNEYSHLQGSIERAVMPLEIPEMLSVAKLIIEKVKEDTEQYAALMNSIGVDIGNT